MSQHCVIFLLSPNNDFHIFKLSYRPKKSIHTMLQQNNLLWTKHVPHCLHVQYSSWCNHHLSTVRQMLFPVVTDSTSVVMHFPLILLWWSNRRVTKWPWGACTACWPISCQQMIQSSRYRSGQQVVKTCAVLQDCFMSIVQIYLMNWIHPKYKSTSKHLFVVLQLVTNRGL